MPKNSKPAAKVKEPKVKPEPELAPTEEQIEAARAEEEQRWLRERAAQNLKQYNQRRVLLVESLKFFKRLRRNATEQRRQQARRKEWSDFLACQINPNPGRAPELRERLYQWRYEQQELERNSVSWTLAADERSLLTQNRGQANAKTRQDLRLLYRNIGAIYVPRIREAVAVLESIERYARSGRIVPPEVLLAADEIRKFISESLDRMTFRIGSNIGRDMETLNPVMGEFCYASDIVAVYLWSFRHVPLPMDYNLLMKVISMKPLGLTLHRPPGFDLKGALIRGLWHEFDHYSGADPTHRLRLQAENPPGTDLSTEQELEWKERQDIRRKRLTALRQLRDDYDSEQRRKEAEAETVATGKQKAGQKETAGRRRSKKPHLTVQATKPSPVPLVITDETEVDIDAEFEQGQSDRARDSLVRIGPASLPLKQGYVNLREFAIVGGVYKLARFAKLPQPVEPRAGFRFSTSRVGLKLTERGYRGRSTGEGKELIKIQLQLPASCFWWEEPHVCCWERQPSAARRRLKSSVADGRVRRGRRRSKAAKIVRDFPLHDRPRVGLHFLIRDHILPRLPDGYRCRAELKQLYTILRECSRRRQALDREQVARDELVAAFDRFLAVQRYGELAQSSAPLIAELRHPVEADIAIGKRRSRWTGLGQGCSIVSGNAAKEMDEKLNQFPLVHPTRPRWLHPASLRPGLPAVIATEGRALEADAERSMGELVRTLQAANTMDDAELDERLCVHFSTFLRLLDYLRDQEKPIFPVRRPPAKVELESVRASASGKQQTQHGKRQTVTRVFKHRNMVVVQMPGRRPSRKAFAPAPMVRRASSLPLVKKKKQRKRRKSESGLTTVAVSDNGVETEGEKKKEVEQKGGTLRDVLRWLKRRKRTSKKKKRKQKIKKNKKQKKERKQKRKQKKKRNDKKQKKKQKRKTKEKKGSVLIEHALGRWSSKPIVRQSYDPDQRIVTFWTDRLGVYGLAARRYSQLPFQHWMLRRGDRTTEPSATVALKTATGLELAFHVTTEGYRLEVVPESIERSSANAPLALPRSDTALTLDELERLLVKLNLHLFPQPDTCFYAAGAIALKHDAMEMHNLQCLAVFCLTHQLEWCLWNRYADRRTALVQCRPQLIEGQPVPEPELATTTIKITPLGALTVEVEELCSPTLEQILLAYHPVPVEQSYNADCYGLLKGSLEGPSRNVLSKTPPLLQWHVGQLLQKLRLLSYS
ncbi:uncharacterized protein LOC118459034 [Anopheles albimanus]|uniref:CASC1 C-terminal domain-containing protein n=1 Tax=Anopheles albimanus TaxID=7167 RepID=A0A182FS05_ANOAL|nr:uncharacterized protein LOC118459034 [Anopheles albimanus]